MKVLLVAESFPPNCGGAGWYAYYLAKALVDKGDEVTVITLKQEARSHGRIKVIVAKEGISRVSKLKKEISKVIKKDNFDIVDVQDIFSAIAVNKLSKEYKVHYIVTIHDKWPFCYKGTAFRSYCNKICKSYDWMDCFKCVFFENNILIKIFSPFVTYYLRHRMFKGQLALKQADGIITNSEFNKNRCNQQIKNKKVLIAYNLFPYINANKIKAYKFPRPTALYIGRLADFKGYGLLIEIAKEMPEMDFVFLGNGEKRKTNLPNVIHKGQVSYDKVLEMIKGAEVIVATALNEESLGRTAVEGSAVGAALIVSNLGGLPEVVENGKTGLVIEPTKEKLKKSLTWILDKKNKKEVDKMKANAIKRYKSVFETEVIINKYKKFVKDIK